MLTGKPQMFKGCIEKMDVPESLSKYTTFDTAILILPMGRLRWSSLLLFNDLSEFQRMPRFETSLDESLSKFPHIKNQGQFENPKLVETWLSQGLD